MSFIRTEARAGLKRWRDMLIGLAVMAWGLYWAIFSLGLWTWFGVILALIGAALAWAGLQRARFDVGSGGHGVVEVDERQVTYLSAWGGRTISLEDLVEVEIASDRLGQAIWRLSEAEQTLTIPAGAEGGGALFDVLTPLPGAEIVTAIRALKYPPAMPVTIWSKDRHRAVVRLTPPA